jgi:hypothetical protein
MSKTFMRQHRPQRTTAQQMHMDMVNFLAAVAVAVHDQTVAIVGKAFMQRFSPRRSSSGLTPLHVRFDVIYGRNQNIGNQNVGRRLRGNVAKSGHQLILIDNIRRDFPANDFAENRFFCHD